MGVDNVFGLTNNELNGIAVMLGVAACFGLLLLPQVQTWYRGVKMKQQRRQEVQRILSDGYADMIMSKVMLRELTWEEARDEGFRRLKQAYPTCKDMYPSEDTLKERIERTLGTNHPVPIPNGERKGMIQRRK